MRIRKIILGMGLAAAVAAALGCRWLLRERSAELRLHGTVEVQEVRLGSKIGGRVAEVLTREGDLVRAGQVLVRFEAPELEAQLGQQRARLAQKEAELEKALNGS